MNRQTTFDIKKFVVQEFGGISALVEAYPIWPAATVQKWCQRESLPGLDLATLLGIVEMRDGRPVPIIEYLGSIPCDESLSPNVKLTPIGSGPSVFD